MKTHVLTSMILAALALSAAGALVGYFALSRADAPRRLAPKTVPKVVAPGISSSRQYRVRIRGYGSVRAKVQVEISPEIPGKVVKRAANFFTGKYVRAGQMLFEIEKTDYEQAYDAAAGRIELLDAQLKRLSQEEANLAESEKIERSRVELAEKQHERARKLLARGAGTENEVDNARELVLTRQQQLQNILNQKLLIGPQRQQLKAERGVTEVEKARAETALKRTIVTSPVEGRVLTCKVEVGEHVQAGAPCGELYGREIMELPVAIPASDLQWIDEPLLEACKQGKTPNQDAERIPATAYWHEPGTDRVFTWHGCVDRIEAGLEAETRTARLVVQVRNPPDGPPARTRPAPGASAGSRGTIPLDINMFCKVEILGKRKAQAFLLPRGAIQPDKSIFLANDGILTRRPVTVSRFTNDKALILPGGGIEEGDRVVLSYVPKPVLGMHVEPIDAVSTGTPPAGASGR